MNSAYTITLSNLIFKFNSVYSPFFSQIIFYNDFNEKSMGAYINTSFNPRTFTFFVKTNRIGLKYFKTCLKKNPSDPIFIL